MSPADVVARLRTLLAGGDRAQARQAVELLRALPLSPLEKAGVWVEAAWDLGWRGAEGLREVAPSTVHADRILVTWGCACIERAMPHVSANVHPKFGDTVRTVLAAGRAWVAKAKAPVEQEDALSRACVAAGDILDDAPDAEWEALLHASFFLDSTLSAFRVAAQARRAVAYAIGDGEAEALWQRQRLAEHLAPLLEAG